MKASHGVICGVLAVVLSAPVAAASEPAANTHTEAKTQPQGHTQPTQGHVQPTQGHTQPTRTVAPAAAWTAWYKCTVVNNDNPLSRAKLTGKGTGASRSTAVKRAKADLKKEIPFNWRITGTCTTSALGPVR